MLEDVLRRTTIFRRLAPEDRTELQGIPVTTPGRTLVDLADVLPRRALERAFDEAEYLRLDCNGSGRFADGRASAAFSTCSIVTSPAQRARGRRWRTAFLSCASDTGCRGRS